MRVFLDTNVLLSAALWPDGVAAACYRSVVTSGADVVISDYVLGEVRDVTRRKFSDRADAIEEFIVALRGFATEAATPDEADADEHFVRDDDDRVVLRAALAAGCDLLVTGDRDLLEAGIEYPEVVKPSDYLVRYAEE